MKHWTQAEREYLEEFWGVKSVKAISNHLGKSNNAIILKAQRLGLEGATKAPTDITLNQFCKAIGISHYTISNRWKPNGFKVHKKFMVKERKYSYVNLDEFWKWAKANKALVNFAHMEENILGKEPDWVNEKRKMDLMDPSKVNHNKVWTPEDNARLKADLKTYRYTYKELAERHNRTQAAIKRQIYNLGISERPIPLNNHVKWTTEENQKLKELTEKGFSASSIAKIVNKSELSIRDRIAKEAYG